MCIPWLTVFFCLPILTFPLGSGLLGHALSCAWSEPGDTMSWDEERHQKKSFVRQLVIFWGGLQNLLWGASVSSLLGILLRCFLPRAEACQDHGERPIHSTCVEQASGSGNLE